MAAPLPTAHEASLLMLATMAATMIGIFIGIFFLFVSIDITIRITAAVLVGVVGVLSFLRHSVFCESDQVRMGWRQDHPEFQIEVGYANLAIGIWALVCGVMLASYGTYLLCALLLHLSRARAPDGLHDPALRKRAIQSVFSTGFFVLALSTFGAVAFARAGVLPSVQLKWDQSLDYFGFWPKPQAPRSAGSRTLMV